MEQREVEDNQDDTPGVGLNIRGIVSKVKNRAGQET